MYWFTRPPYLRWGAAAVIVIAAFAIELRPETKVQHHLVDNRDVWEFVPVVEEQAPELALDLEIEGGFDFETPVAAPAPAKENLLPHAALTVANGHLLVATHMDYLVGILQRPANKPTVAATTDFQRVRDAMEKLGAGHDTTHVFTRLAGALEVTYELTRTGRLPESKSMLGLLLNLIHNDDSQRTQQFDGSKMPAFQSVAKYLGPHGVFVQTEFADFYRAMFEQQTRKENERGVFLEYAWDMAWCDPCAADPLSNDELRKLGVFWVSDSGRGRIAPGQPQNVFVTRLHLRYDREHFPEDLMFQETGDRQNFQGRYVIRHPFKGALTCDASQYIQAVRERQDREAQTLAKLTGWDIDDIRARIDYIDGMGPPPDKDPWWKRIWQ